MPTPLPRGFDARLPKELTDIWETQTDFNVKGMRLCMAIDMPWDTVKETAETMPRQTHVGKVAKLITNAKDRDGPQPLAVVLPEVAVRFNTALSEKEIQTLLNEQGTIQRSVTFAPNQWVIDANSPEDALALSQDLRRNKVVEFAEPILIRNREIRELQEDPLLHLQWHLKNNGRDGGTMGSDVGAEDAWKITRGNRRIVIAILDPSGVQVDHEDLRANRYINLGEASLDGSKTAKQSNNSDDDGNQRKDDLHGWNFLSGDNKLLRTASANEANALGGIIRADGLELLRGHKLSHGTSVAGLAVARGGNGIGVSGLAPECRFMTVTLGVSDQDDADAFYYAAAQGADVISCSWGYPIGTPSTELVERAIENVAKPGPTCLGRHGLGSVVVFAMTNERVDNFGDLNGPNSVMDISSLEHVIAVGRSTNKDTWGESGFGSGMHLLAPSHAAKGTPNAGCDPSQMVGTLEITTTDLMGKDGINDGRAAACFCNSQVHDDPGLLNYTQCFNGTSAATPLVAAAAALCLSVRPNATSLDIRSDLTQTANKIDQAAANYDANGHSQTHGFGRLNAGKAVALSRDRHQADKRELPMLKRRALHDLKLSLAAIESEQSHASDADRQLKDNLEKLIQQLELELTPKVPTTSQ